MLDPAGSGAWIYAFIRDSEQRERLREMRQEWLRFDAAATEATMPDDLTSLDARVRDRTQRCACGHYKAEHEGQYDGSIDCFGKGSSLTGLHCGCTRFKPDVLMFHYREPGPRPCYTKDLRKDAKRLFKLAAGVQDRTISVSSTLDLMDIVSRLLRLLSWYEPAEHDDRLRRMIDIAKNRWNKEHCLPGTTEVVVDLIREYEGRLSIVDPSPEGGLSLALGPEGALSIAVPSTCPFCDLLPSGEHYWCKVGRTFVVPHGEWTVQSLAALVVVDRLPISRVDPAWRAEVESEVTRFLGCPRSTPAPSGGRKVSR